MRGQNYTHYLRCGWTMAVESDEVIFGLLSIPFLIIPNIRFAFFLVASEPWADVFIQGSLLSGNSQLRAHHFIMNLGLFFPTCIALCLYTRNFICHFIAQSLSLIRTFCNSSPFTIPTVKNQQEACGSFSSGKVSRVWATQRDSSLCKVVWMSCCYTFLRTNWALSGRLGKSLQANKKTT